MSMFEDELIRIPVRPDLTIMVHGIPHDLTHKEALRVAKVILAYMSLDMPMPRNKLLPAPEEA